MKSTYCKNKLCVYLVEKCILHPKTLKRLEAFATAVHNTASSVYNAEKLGTIDKCCTPAALGILCC